MITINKANPTSGEITSSLTNSADGGAGLKFDGAAGNIVISTVPDFGDKFSFEFIIQADVWGTQQHILDFGTGGRFMVRCVGADDSLAVYDSGGDHSFGDSTLADLKVHHIVITIDGTAAILYDNGNQAGTATVAADHGDLDDCTDGRIGSKYNDAAAANFNGTIYRARF